MTPIKSKGALENDFQGAFLFIHSAPGGARFLRVQVPNPPGSGKDIAEQFFCNL